MTKDDLIEVMKKHPNLTATGMDCDEDPNELIEYLDACNAACEWLSLVKRTKKPNPKIGGSYRLKHKVERWYIKKYNKRCYTPNGAFIAAAYHLGFMIIPKPGTPNVYLNISTNTKIDGDYI
ncbi:MAG: hypothetical protein JXA06_02350 [Bacteroidetes bacterium]|nr:hypothetical protein [Bacteroidota bacterium]